VKVYIAAALEGIGGVSTWDVPADAKGRTRYERFMDHSGGEPRGSRGQHQRIMGMKFNGTAIPDAGLAPATAGEFGVATAFVFADQTVGRR
jgi:D-aminopeptidase